MSEGRLRRWLKRLVVVGFALGVLGVITLLCLYQWFVVHTPAPHIEREAILEVISQESPVFYRDGTTKLGVFFSEEHRQYVPAGELPGAFVDALVSAEDRGFFEHPGFSVKGISRAMIQNIAAGRTVAGGSTLTQQTAKNLFERRGRTYREKLRELANALRLERKYTKLEIIEFYSNQFYVNGNGRGLGIASRFFFDKPVLELDALECAFLAGIVKSPNRYNPFVPDPDRRERAIVAGRERADYVLRRMLEDGKIDQATHDREVEREIPFKRGRFRFERSVVLDAVEAELDSPEFRRALAAHGVVDPGSAGLRIVTTLDPEMQRGALYSLRHHLSDVGLWLEAPGVTGLVTTAPTLHPVEAARLVPQSFHKGVLSKVDVDAATATVDLGGTSGVIGPAAWTRVATALLRGEKKNTWVNAGHKQRAKLLEELQEHVGEGVSVSVIRLRDDGSIELDLEPSVELEGGVLVLDGGEVRAMAGGWKNVDFNRALAAKRQLGSTWKPVLFEAALHLGWQATDPLDNRRAVFPYQSTFYYPRPDHKGAPDRVSIGWAAVKSENVASIWLLEHLSDPLTKPQFRALAAHVGLTPGESEDHRTFVKRIQKAGVLPTEAKLVEGLLQEVWAGQIAPDLLFEGREADAELGLSLQYGLGHEAELERVLGGAYDVSAAEKEVRIDALGRSFLRQERLAAEAREARSAVLDRMAAGEEILDEHLAGFVYRGGGEQPVEISFGERHPESWEPLDRAALDRLSGRGDPEPSDPQRPVVQVLEGGLVSAPEGAEWDVFAPEVPTGAAPEIPPTAPPAFAVTSLLDVDQVRLEGLLTIDLVARTREALNEARARLGEVRLYDMEVLALTKDYRRLVHLTYLASLARRSGVRSDIAHVMSMPLGSSDITLLEAALLYQGMLTGETYRFYGDVLAAAQPTVEVELPVETEEADASHRDDVSLIAEVRLPTGAVIYRTTRQARTLQSPELTAELGSMLRAVVTDGTGRRARAGVRPGATSDARAAELEKRGVVLPLFGKTGTTNSYKNSAFVGFVPGLPPAGAAEPGTEPLKWGRGQVVAVYVGYDDNREMRNGAVRLAGASGSLPAWLGTVEAVARASDVGERVDLVELDFGTGGQLPVSWPAGTTAVAVDRATGLPLGPDVGDEGGGVAWLRRRTEGPSFAPVEL